MTDGDTEMVTVASSSRGSSPKCFHTRDCNTNIKRPMEMPRSKAERRGLEHCPNCQHGGSTGEAKRDYNELVTKLRDKMDVETQT